MFHWASSYWFPDLASKMSCVEVMITKSSPIIHQICKSWCLFSHGSIYNHRMNLTNMYFSPKMLLKYQPDMLQCTQCVDMAVLSHLTQFGRVELQGMLGGHWKLWTGLHRERFPYHHGSAIPTCIMGTPMRHVPRCMPGSLTNGFLWSRSREKRSRHPWRMRNPQFYVSGKRPMATASHDKKFSTCCYWKCKLLMVRSDIQQLSEPPQKLIPPIVCDILSENLV